MKPSQLEISALTSSMKIISLFSGCGGFSVGAQQAGFEISAAFDNDPILTSSYRRNFPSTNIVISDISQAAAGMIFEAAGGKIDGVFGGPPCQSFSSIGKRRANDPRRLLVGHFFRIVRDIQPSFFVMENVPGLGHSRSQSLLNEALDLVRNRYAVSGPHIWNAAHFGAATRRLRLFIVGIHQDCADAFRVDEVNALKLDPVTVRAAIGDLEGAQPLGEADGFDFWQIRRFKDASDYARSLQAPGGRFTGHRKTNHSAEVVARFEGLAQGATDLVGRHPRLAWSGQCPALRAGTGADQGSFQSVRPIHPEYPRVITVREAARLQGFPDSHLFHPTIWHSFRMIGNSVSPIMAKAIFTALRTRLEG